MLPPSGTRWEKSGLLRLLVARGQLPRCSETTTVRLNVCRVNDMDVKKLLLDQLKPRQARAVESNKRCVLVVAGAGSGKTEVMARRIAWWVGVESVPKESQSHARCRPEQCETGRVCSHARRTRPPCRTPMECA